jgi:hypothetical protein
MNGISRMIVLSTVILLLTPLPPVDQNEWLSPDIVMEAVKLGAPMKAEKGGPTKAIPTQNIKTSGEAKQNAGSPKK